MSYTNTAYNCPGYRGTNFYSGTSWPSYGSYAYNAGGVVNAPITTGTYPPLVLGLGIDQQMLMIPPIKESQVRVPSEMIAITESRLITDVNNPLFVLESGVDFGGTSPHGWVNPARHGTNYNTLYCDGHVVAVNPSVLFDPAKSAADWNNDHQPHAEIWTPIP